MISVIIPTYNRAGTLTRSVDSVLNQTYKNLELIIVDDASEDETENIVNNIDDNRVHYIKLKENCGACNARNVGVENATGEFIAFQDSDDIWHQDKLEKQLDFMVKMGLDFVFCGMTRIMMENPEKNYFYPNVDIDDEKPYFEQLLYINRVGTQTILCKKSCFAKIHFDVTLKRFQDWDLALQATRYFKMGYLRESLVDSYIQKDSISKSFDSNKSAWRTLYEKYAIDICKHKQIQAKFMFRLGNEAVQNDINLGRKYYKESLSIAKSKAALLFYVLSCLRQKRLISVLLHYQQYRLFK